MADDLGMPVLVRSPALASLQRPAAGGDWTVPVEMCLPLTRTMFADVIRRRRARNEVRPLARVFARGRMLFAVVDFVGEGRPGLLIQLHNVDLWENRGDAP